MHRGRSSLITLALLLAGCEIIGDSGSWELPITGAWEADRIDVARGTFNVPEGDQYIFHFRPDGRVTTESSGCNACDGTYRVLRRHRLEAEVVCTEAACDDLWRFGVPLTGTSTYEVDEDSLIITNTRESTNTTVRFVRPEAD